MSRLALNLDVLVPIVGAAIVVGSAMVSGLRAHRFAERHAPQIARLVTRDVVILAAAVVGAALVARWLV